VDAEPVVDDAKNRPIIRPTVATLGQSAVSGLETDKRQEEQQEDPPQGAGQVRTDAALTS